MFEAGKGEHGVYKFGGGSGDGTPLERTKHYIAIDAVAWFLNKKSNWFKNRMASGTLRIALANGHEVYDAALGTYQLSGGARFAPVFENTVLPERSYRGGDITLNAFLSGVKKDTALGGMLKSAAKASLGIVSGMIETATLAGPQKVLSAAGGSLVDGVRDVLENQAEKREPMFDFSGLQYGIRAEEMAHDEKYVLLHRGALLDQEKLEVDTQGSLLLPFYDGHALTDGAWLLLRVRRTTEYTGARPWYPDASTFRLRLKDLVTDLSIGGQDRDALLAEFRPSDRGNSTAYDEFVRLRAVINQDGVLTETQATVFKGQLTSAFLSAKEAVEEDTPEAYASVVTEQRNAIGAGKVPPRSIGLLKAEAVRTAEERNEPAFSFEDVDLDELVKVLPQTFDASLPE